MSVVNQQRIGIFVDVQNMFYAAKHLYNSKLNFSRLREYIARGRPLVRSIAYVVQTPEIDQSNFLTMLRSNAFEVRAKDLKHRPDGSPKGDWDMGLALDALAMCERLDVVAIVSGDGDFVELVNFLKARGVRVEVYSFPYSTSEELRHAATEYYQMGTEIVMGTASLRSVNSQANHYEHNAHEIHQGTPEATIGHSENHSAPLEHGEQSPRYSNYP
jgi:uncharacterized LabA/DUF88 family protein